MEWKCTVLDVCLNIPEKYRIITERRRRRGFPELKDHNLHVAGCLPVDDATQMQLNIEHRQLSYAHRSSKTLEACIPLI